MNPYVITAKHLASGEPYLSAIMKDVPGGRNVLRIVQNRNVSDKVNKGHIDRFLAEINNCRVSELPPLDDFIATNVIVLEAKRSVGSCYSGDVSIMTFDF